MRIALILTLFLCLFFASKPVFAWDDCPFGEVNDPFPGECARYIDTDNNGICDHSQPASEDRIAQEEILAKQTGGQEDKPPAIVKNNREKYYLLPITVVLFLGYGLTLYLAKKKKIAVVSHRKIWNIILAISFLLTAVSGILLVLKVSYGLKLDFPFFLFWHVEFGIVFAVIALFHFLWHWPYYKGILKV